MSAFETPAVGSSEAAQAIRFLDTLSFVRVAGDDTDGRQAVVEMRLREGHAPPMHVHEAADETVHVVDGTLAVRTDDGEHRLDAGGSVVLPRGEPHSLHAMTEARTVVTAAPAGSRGSSGPWANRPRTARSRRPRRRRRPSTG